MSPGCRAAHPDDGRSRESRTCDVQLRRTVRRAQSPSSACPPRYTSDGARTALGIPRGHLDEEGREKDGSQREPGSGADRPRQPPPGRAVTVCAASPNGSRRTVRHERTTVDRTMGVDGMPTVPRRLAPAVVQGRRLAPVDGPGSLVGGPQDVAQLPVALVGLDRHDDGVVARQVHYDDPRRAVELEVEGAALGREQRDTL